MIPIIVVSHGQMALGIENTFNMIVGKQDNIHFLGLTEDNPNQFSEELKNVISFYEEGQEILILADLYGGSPFLASAQLLLELNSNIQIISGANLPMLIECAMCRQSKNGEELAELAVASGKESIKAFEKSIENEVDNDGI